MKEEPIFTREQGQLYRFISWLQLEKGYVLVDRRTADTPSLGDMIKAIQEFAKSTLLSFKTDFKGIH